MKKLVLFLVFGLLMAGTIRAQQTQYMVFDFIKVENDQIFDYIEFKDLMEKVYRQALNDKKIKGWGVNFNYLEIQNDNLKSILNFLIFK